MDILQNKELEWDHYTGESLGLPVDYSGTTLGIYGDNRIDVLYRWAPNSYCHFHRHVAPISSVVLEGELRVVDFENGKEVGSRLRKKGDYSHKEAIEDHIEQGGPEGALVMFSLYAPDGVLTQRLSDDGEVMTDITVDMIRQRAGALV